MPLVPLAQIKPNPFRDFELHPIDPVQVDRLKASIGADGFWASVVARKVGGEYEIAFGHHRIEAARSLGFTEAPIDVRALSDWQMVRMLSSENATQRGTSAAAALDAVAATSKVLCYLCIRYDLAEVSKNIETFAPKAVESIWGKVRQGEGPGEQCILDLLPANSYTRAQARIALGVLKDSGRMAAILAQARAKAEAEIADEEQPEPEAEVAQKKRRATSTKRALVPASAAPQTEPAPIFDASCAKLFKLDSHLAEFRRIVTDPTVRSFLPVDQQFAFAKAIFAKLGSRELTAISLREQANILLHEGVGASRANLSTSKKRPTDHRITDGMNLLRRGTHSVEKGCRMLESVLEEGLEFTSVQLARLDELSDHITDALAALKPDARKRRANLRVIRNEGEDVA
jgi:hypothetical protein